MRSQASLVVLALLLASVAVAQTTPFIVAGNRSNYGSTELRGGFSPDPFTVELLSGGNLSIRGMGLGPRCVGHAMARPDYIVRYSEPADRLRFYVRANGGDSTLVVHSPDGRWLCDDDSGRGTNPLIDLPSPPAGTYEIWVGSYRHDQNLRATLMLTGGDDIP